MSYASVETSAHGGQPVELYRFSAGTRKWTYTSTDAAITYLNESYESYAIKRGAIRQTAELAKTGLEIRTVRNMPFIAEMIASPLTDVVRVDIYRKHRSDSDTVPIWRGRVEGVRFEGSEAVISCQPWATSLKRIGLRRPAQRQCPHAVYDGGCGLTAAVFAVSGTLTSHTGLNLTASVFATQADGWWVGGRIDFSGTQRFIIGHAGDTVTLSSGIPNLPQGAPFLVYPGCDHTPATCNSKFANLANYGGAPAFPIKNPFTGDSAF